MVPGGLIEREYPHGSTLGAVTRVTASGIVGGMLNLLIGPGIATVPEGRLVSVEGPGASARLDEFVMRLPLSAGAPDKRIYDSLHAVGGFDGDYPGQADVIATNIFSGHTMPHRKKDSFFSRHQALYQTL